MAKKKKKSVSSWYKNPPFVWSFVLLTLLIAGFLGYSAYQYQQSEEEHVGFFICSKDNKTCELSQHIHADIEMSVCGEEINFPKEKGRTDKQHTHKERNKIHWHARLRVDPVTRMPLDTNDITLAAFLQQMKVTLPQTCPNNPQSTLIVEVNGKPAAKNLETIWQDGDTIKVIYQ